MKTTKLLVYIATGLQFLVLVGMLLLTISQKSIIEPYIAREMGKGFIIPFPVIGPAFLVFLIYVIYAIAIQFTGKYNKVAKSVVGIGLLVLMILVQCVNPYINTGFNMIFARISSGIKAAALVNLSSHISLMTSPVATIASALFYTACGTYLKTSAAKKEEVVEEA